MAKSVIRLTESELTSLIKRVIEEQMSVAMEDGGSYMGVSTKNGQTYFIDVKSSMNGMMGDVDIYLEQQKIADGVLMSVGPRDGVPKGCWGFSNNTAMKKNYGDFKNIRKIKL